VSLESLFEVLDTDRELRILRVKTTDDLELIEVVIVAIVRFSDEDDALR
jgi:hypothetical protein